MSADGGALLGGIPYNNGAVVGGVRVVQVLWGAGGVGSYADFVTSSKSPNVPSFYQGILASPYADLLAEYGAQAQPIKRGTFVSRYTITPSAKGPTIDDSAVQTELVAQIAANKLPAPYLDNAGNAQTYYAIYFPKGLVITRGASKSCSASVGFCAYHSVLPGAGNRPKAYYGVHPDMQFGSGCDQQCGSASGPFALQTAVASRALVDTITDPDFPRAWYSWGYGEVGDVCTDRPEVTGGDGFAYTVQSVYSNAQSGCVTSPPGVPSQTGDFSLGLASSSATVVQGSAASTLVSTTFVSGVALPVSLAVTGAPAGMTAVTLAPTLKAGGATTLVVTTQPSTAPGTYALTVTGTEGANVHSATFKVTVLADFSLAAAPASLTLTTGKTASATVGTSGGTDPVALTVSGLPVGVTGSLSPATLAPNGSSTLKLSASLKATFGPATVSVTGTTSKGVTHTATLALNVTGDSFNLAVSPASVTVPAGKDVSVTVSTSVASGSPEPVSFVLSNLAPVTGTTTFAPTTVQSGDSSLLTFHLKSGAMAGTTKAWITANAPSGPARMASVSVTVLNDDFTFGAPSPSQLTIKPGTTQSASGTTSLAYGASQSIALSVDGVPQGVTAVVSPSTIKTGGSYTVTFSAPPKAKLIPGPWTVSVIGKGVTAQHSTGVVVNTAN